MLAQEHYNHLIVRARMDHSKFNDLEKSLSAQTIVDMLTEDFKVLQKFTAIRTRLPKKSYETYMELEVAIREMMESDTPSSEQWKAVERLGKTKFTLPPLEQVVDTVELMGQRLAADLAKDVVLLEQRFRVDGPNFVIQLFHAL